MKQFLILHSKICILFLFLALLLQASQAVGEPRVMAIVAGADFPKDQLTLEELKAIYLGEIQILKYIRVQPMDQRHNQPIRKKFLDQVLYMTRDYYIDYWNKRLFREGGLTPLLKNNSREVLEAVRDQEGAVGYVWLDEAEGREGIKILLTIDLK